MSTLEFSADLSKTATSIRPLSPEEKNSITATRLRLVEAVSGETLSALCDRTGNAWSVERTAMVNGLEKDALLKEGMLLKIAKTEAYP